MLAAEGVVRSRDRQDRLGRGDQLTAGGQESWRGARAWVAEELGQDLPPENLGQQRRDGVTDLPLRRGQVADDLDVIWEGLEAAHLAAAQSSVRPVERPDGWPWLCLNRPRG